MARGAASPATAPSPALGEEDGSVRPRPDPLPPATVAWAMLACLCCLGGYLLRAHRLGVQSLWLDEGASYWFARLPVGQLLAATFSSEPNPPLYYLLLHGWIGGAGTSEYALRFLSLLPGVLTIALVYRLGRDLISPSAAAGAAILTTVSPYLIWYAQEARMYALLGCLATAAVLALFRALRCRTWHSWLGFGILLPATLYSHFYGVFVLLVCVLCLAVALRRRATRRAWRCWLPAFSIPMLLFLPWLTSTLRSGGAGPNWRGPAGLATVARSSAAAFVHNGFLLGALGDRLLLIEALLAAAGITLAARFGRRGPAGAGLLLAALVLPAASVVVLSHWASIFGTNYVIGQAPFFTLAVAAGVTLALRPAWLGIPGLLALAACSLLAVNNGWNDQRFSKEDFRDAARLLDSQAAPGDVIVLAAEYARLPFNYYYRGSAQEAPFTGHADQPGAVLSRLTAHRRIVWLLLSHSEQVDPKGQIRRWLDDHYPLATEAFPQGIQIYGYRADYRLAALPAGVVPLQRRFGNSIELAGYEARGGIPPTDRALHPPSNWLHVVLYWRAITTPATSYQSSVQLVDGRGVWGAELERPGSALRLYPTQRWHPGEIVVDDIDINLNPTTPPGQYQLSARLLAPDGRPLPAAGGSVLPVAITITPP